MKEISISPELYKIEQSVNEYEYFIMRIPWNETHKWVITTQSQKYFLIDTHSFQWICKDTLNFDTPEEALECFKAYILRP